VLSSDGDSEKFQVKQSAAGKQQKGGRDFETDSYHAFGDTEDHELSSKNSNQEEQSAQQSTKKGHFLIKSNNEYLTGYKEKVLGE